MTQSEQRVQIVGIDGSDPARTALDWALARSNLLGPVQPVMAWRYPWWAALPPAAGTLVPPTEAEFAAIAQKMVRNVLADYDATCCLEPRVVHGSPGSSLVAIAKQASLLVIGSRGRGAVASGLLGSVGSHCVHHADVPVAVVPADADAVDQHGRVIVGVDGSTHSMRAVRWAIDNTPPSSTIDVIHTWDSDVVAARIAAVSDVHLAVDSERVLDEVRREAGSEAQGLGRTLEGHSIQGDARDVLRREATDADLLVVGSRGVGRLAHMLLGSTATSLVHQPSTTTVVVP